MHVLQVKISEIRVPSDLECKTTKAMIDFNKCELRHASYDGEGTSFPEVWMHIARRGWTNWALIQVLNGVGNGMTRSVTEL